MRVFEVGEYLGGWTDADLAEGFGGTSGGVFVRLASLLDVLLLELDLPPLF